MFGLDKREHGFEELLGKILTLVSRMSKRVEALERRVAQVEDAGVEETEDSSVGANPYSDTVLEEEEIDTEEEEDECIACGGPLERGWKYCSDECRKRGMRIYAKGYATGQKNPVSEE